MEWTRMERPCKLLEAKDLAPLLHANLRLKHKYSLHTLTLKYQQLKIFICSPADL